MANRPQTPERSVRIVEDVGRTDPTASFYQPESIKGERDVAIDTDGLVTYLGVHTLKPLEVADALLTEAAVELVMPLPSQLPSATPPGATLRACMISDLRAQSE